MSDTRSFWEAVEKTSKEVSSWPNWRTASLEKSVKQENKKKSRCVKHQRATMSDKEPERIWMVGTDPYTGTCVWTSDDEVSSDFPKPDLSGATEYIRADLYEAVEAERDALKAKCESM
jgi:hypothetical protein